MRLRFGGASESAGGNGTVRVERVSVGLLSVGSWRYLTTEDALRYLQHFLVPNAGV